ncbi:hypothetical protein KY290_024883 [Solanum tuberosum]|uniref:Uncharacterized protein n=1 Tax=Solanum tuberosum TaxID=4113 RepID=A0ABQ7UTZ2_SOLTU|nr:hypothetical protein KY290_024883 [Solanum tuberosum]
MAREAVVSAFERSIKNIIKEFSIPTGLPWHLVDDVYILDSHIGMLLGPEIVFQVEFVQDIMQQQSDSFAFAEYLSDGMPVPKIGFRSEYLRTRYGALLWNYGTEKAKAGYVRENADPTRPTSHPTEPAQEDLVNVD